LTGAGRAFSAGGDFDFLNQRLEENDAEVNQQEMLKFYERFLAVRKIRVPVIAAINGHAVVNQSSFKFY
jgi:enoyl-CoA hydratase